MVRRITAIALILSFLLLWGCGTQSPEKEMGSPIKFYYKVSDDRFGTTKQATEFELFDAVGHETDYSWILEAYFNGPSSQELLAPFPKSMRLISAQREDSVLRVNLSEELSRLTGIDLTVACSCITLTCLELEGIETVTITANGRSMDGKYAISMSREDLLLEDFGATDMASTYRLYFSDTENRYLIAEELTIDDGATSVAYDLLQKLIEGPVDAGLAQTVPLETEVLNLEIQDGICNLELSNAFLDNAPKTEPAQRMTVLSITNTLTQLDGINSLVLYVEGARLERYGMLDLGQPLTYDEDAVGPARTNLNELDMDLYLYNGTGDKLSKVPARVRQSADKLVAELTLQKLLEYGNRNGYSSGIPTETELVEMYVEQGVCVVVLSQAVLSEQESPEQGFRAVWATVLSAGEYDSVQIQVENYSPTEDELYLFEAKQWDDGWLLGNS